ncbi:MAG: 5-methyltetrahydropteroyltriglutamate-- homocysteine methyltransferase [Candidatus Bathyarchaeota archaeon BA2]|nr:MAG: 5-methyltetrahydropteroyltriglutamate-- homocysteine methyltransferase [Candidatus Bathyarchaeota archaeon BA2]
MIKSCDVGSLPFQNDIEKFLEGAARFDLYPDDDSVKYFEEKLIKGFLDKVEAGVDIPNYPQFRDMNEMFPAMMEGVERMKGGYIETKIPSVTENRSHIPELTAIKKNSQMIREKKGKPFQIKVCVTGPYTLSSLFIHRDNEIFSRLGNAISQIVENNIFSEKHGGVSLVAVDEPIFGMLDDPLIDYGSEGRENLRKAWEAIFHKVKSKNVQTLLHLHNTADELFWEVKSLNVIDSHVDDPLYQMKKTKEQLETADKFLKASICTVEFDTLIKKRIMETSRQKMTEPTINEKIAEAWTSINSQKTDPKIFLEDVDLMKKRLVKVVGRFGVERVPYAGPECGLKGFPTYESALECLRRVSSAVENATKNVKA